MSIDLVAAALFRAGEEMRGVAFSAHHSFCRCQTTADAQASVKRRNSNYITANLLHSCCTRDDRLCPSIKFGAMKQNESNTRDFTHPGVDVPLPLLLSVAWAYGGLVRCLLCQNDSLWCWLLVILSLLIWIPLIVGIEQDIEHLVQNCEGQA